jgi:uncharacterized protein YdhG (YjbR/CyaY superfamily)
MGTEKPETIDEYIAGCDPEIQPLLKTIRETIVKAAPQAGEKISWGMPTFTHYGNLVHFSAEKKHIGFHPAPSSIIAFEKELADYQCSKGTVRFPYNQPLPLELITKIVTFRVKEQEEIAEKKKLEKKIKSGV